MNPDSSSTATDVTGTELTIKPPPEQSSADIMTVISRAASDPAVDVDKLERLFALKERMDTQERERLFAEALAKVQAAAPPITKQGRTDKSRYARLEDIDTKMRPLMEAEGFSLSFDTDVEEGRILMTAKLRHRGGHFEEKHLILPVDTGAGRNAIQAVGSTVSYGRRHLTKMIFNIVETELDDDMDGETPVPVTLANVKKIRDLIAKKGVNYDKFLAWAKVEVLEHLSQKQAVRAIAALNRKQDVKEGS